MQNADELEHLSDRIDDLERTLESLQENIIALNNNTQWINDIKGAARIGIALQRFALWLAKFGAVGAAISCGVVWVVNQLDNI